MRRIQGYKVLVLTHMVVFFFFYRIYTTDYVTPPTVLMYNIYICIFKTCDNNHVQQAHSAPCR